MKRYMVTFAELCKHKLKILVGLELKYFMVKG